MGKLVNLIFLALCFVACAVKFNVEANATGRVVGGFDAELDQFPYQISLRFNHKHNCGGSIIGPKYILTAAHCVVATGIEPHNAANFTVRAGTQNRIAGGVIIQVKRITVHEGYGGVANDLALIELEEELVYSSSIQPIAIATEEVPPDQEIIISGWGLLINNGDSLPIILQWNTVTSISKTKCASKIGISSDAIICLDHPKGAGACNGDSGGPAVYDNQLVGVAGFVFIGCGTSRPDGYAKVSYNVDWIHNNMK